MATNVAAEFNTGWTYAVNDLALYGGNLYRFTSAKTAGAWDSSKVTAVDDLKEEQITRILAGMDNAEAASDYADTIVFAPTQIKETRYKYVLTNAPDPRQ